jgi:hypothetical protein
MEIKKVYLSLEEANAAEFFFRQSSKGRKSIPKNSPGEQLSESCSINGEPLLQNSLGNYKTFEQEILDSLRRSRLK